MVIKHVPSMCQNFTSLLRRFPLLRPSPPLSRRNPSTCLGRHLIACSCTGRMSMSRIPCDGRGARRPQGQSFHESVGPAALYQVSAANHRLTIRVEARWFYGTDLGIANDGGGRAWSFRNLRRKCKEITPANRLIEAERLVPPVTLL